MVVVLDKQSIIDKGTNWLSGHSGLTKSSNFSQLVKLRLGRLETKENCNRGRKVDKKCRGCKARIETQHHILCACPKTHGLRIHRHEKVIDLLIKEAEENNFSTMKEPRFTTTLGLRKPDLIFFKDNKAAIVDVTIVNESYDLDGTTYDLNWHWNNKINKYDIEDITSKVKTLTNCNDIKVFGLVISIRGIWFNKNDDLLKFLNIRITSREIFCIRAMEYSVKIWRNFMKQH